MLMLMLVQHMQRSSKKYVSNIVNDDTNRRAAIQYNNNIPNDVANVNINANIEATDFICDVNKSSKELEHSTRMLLFRLGIILMWWFQIC